MTNLMNLGENLSKKQMNNVTGGARCTARDKNGNVIGTGSYSNMHIAKANVEFAIALDGHGWEAGDYSMSCI